MSLLCCRSVLLKTLTKMSIFGQEAAGIFAHISATLHQRMPPPLPTDLASDATATLQAVCLAQVVPVCIAFAINETSLSIRTWSFFMVYVLPCFVKQFHPARDRHRN